MTAPSRKKVDAKTPTSRRKSSVRLANAQDQASPSQVRRWQESLHDEWAQSERRGGDGAKWSGRRTFAFVALTCGGFWACVIVGAARLVR